MGLCFTDIGSTVFGLADLYDMSESSVKRCINMCLDTVDFNTDLAEMQIKLPNSTDLSALKNPSQGWLSILTTCVLIMHNIGCLDGWLLQTEAPSVSDQADYFSGHYRCHELNIQALCDPNLTFIHVAIAAPGKVNHLRASNRCTDLLKWLNVLPNEFYIFGDNAYTLSRRVLIPFKKPDMVAPRLDYDVEFL